MNDMMRTLLVTLVLLIGCKKSGSTTSPPTGPGTGTGTDPGMTAGSGSAMCGAPNQGSITKEQCECLGGHVKASIGGGDEAHCAPGETEVATVSFGVEGGWCCKGS